MPGARDCDEETLKRLQKEHEHEEQRTWGVVDAMCWKDMELSRYGPMGVRINSCEER